MIAADPSSTDRPSTDRRLGRGSDVPISVIVAVTGLVVLIIVAIVGPWVIDADPLRTAAGPPNAAPGTDGHVLGTDSLGRDLLARVVVGGRASLLVGLAVSVSALAVGSLVGLAAAAGPSWLDWVVIRLIDALTTVPFLVLVLALRAVLPPGVGSTVLVLAAFSWMPVARVVRAQVLSLRGRLFIEAAVIGGASRRRVLFGHLLPNAAPPVLAVASAVCAEAIIAETTLSWLGLGIPVETPSWGNILVDAQREILIGNWWSLAAPAVAIAITIACAGMLASQSRRVDLA
ncbi:MAG: ABC transporter permease [Actinomycetota bacterium]